MVKPEGKSSGRRWEVNIKMDLTERGWDGADWIHLAQNREH
jgi:hypothetical protein